MFIDNQLVVERDVEVVAFHRDVDIDVVKKDFIYFKAIYRRFSAKIIAMIQSARPARKTNQQCLLCCDY